MSKISLSPDASGTGIFTIASPNSNTNRTLTLPDDTGTIVTNSGNQAGSFTTLNTSGAVVFNDAGADVDFRVEGDTNANLLFVDASADAVGVGTSSPAQRLHVIGNSQVVPATSTDAVWMRANNTSGSFYLGIDNDAGSGFTGTAYARFLYADGAYPMIFYTNGTERMRINSDGAVRLLGASTSIFSTPSSGQITQLDIGANVNGTYNNNGAAIRLESVDAQANGNILFSTNQGGVGSSERMRITSKGYLKVSNSGSYIDAGGTYHEIVQTGQNTVLNARNTYNWGAGGGDYGINLSYTGHSPNNTNSTFAFFADSTATRALIYSNGTFGSATSTYGGISDIKLKQDIVDANSQWDDIKGLRIRKYRFKNDVATDPNCPAHLGVIAQEAELVSPGLVFESPDFEDVSRIREIEKIRVVTEAVLDQDGNEIEPAVTETYIEEEEYIEREPTGTVTKSVKYSILYMKAVKALQEAMERIETLEASNTALEARIAALETGA